MADSLICLAFLFIFISASSIRPVSSSAASLSSCLPHSNSFLYDLQLQCTDAMPISSLIQIDGESLDSMLDLSSENAYTAVLFHASWCPFSVAVLPKFSALSSLFPQIQHVMIEQSNVMPSLLSRYGIHSLPAIILMNKTEKVRYYGQKDLVSLVQFYKNNTGIDPVLHLTEDEIPEALERTQILDGEPYLVFSVLFVLFRTLVYFFPRNLYHQIALRVASMTRLNWGFLVGLSHLLGRVIQLIDVKSMWVKLKLCKTQNFHRAGKSSARVWASSFASVS
ncbi:5'-adenylylsulfate reductase-like 5 [Impatiens glandulifera]|uniref:5'-adenylylsulfate reductase-like 5 n=1 Tax=Impatiens glandulifera TaxID=253017 RepID=UPI001FB13E79|nr:5'-adenylylsulfate reductase-like 5 [Impatiens glandulifera]